MKVLDLQCCNAHLFEGWFASETDFQEQLRRGLVQCPMCGAAQISKRLSAPRLNLGARSALAESPMKGTDDSSAHPHASLNPAQQAAWLALARKVIANTEDVGAQFAQEVRRMHYGETEERAIRGQATPDEAVQLLEEGIAVVPLLLPEGLKETLQ